MGPHKLTIDYSGNSSTAPLTLAYLVVQNGTLPGSTGSSSQATANGKSSTNVGAIIGGAVGGAAGLLIVFLLFRYYRRRRDSTKDEGVMIDAPVTPFPMPRSSSDALVSALQSYQTPSTAFISDSDVARSGNPSFISGRKLGSTQDGRTMGNVPQFVTIPQAPSRQEVHLPHHEPTKIRNNAGNNAAEGLAPSSDQQHSRNPSSDLSNVGSPSGFVHQDSGVRITSQGLSQALADIPPAYTAD